ncbi:MAG: hypothetical protein HQK79_20940 [Desulfobacterales bacterium]|nr:hypothetical protein [Desulfobacterales bacterium]
MKIIKIFILIYLFLFICAINTFAEKIEESLSFQNEIPDWKARWELAKVLSYTKNYKESIIEYEKVLKEKPDLKEAKLEMVKILLWSGESAKATKILSELPGGDLDDELKVAMADIYIAKKDYSKAEIIYLEYIKKHPADYKTLLKFADMLSWMKKYNESITRYQEILKALPNDNEVRKKYGQVLVWAGKYDEAIKELKKALYK